MRNIPAAESGCPSAKRLSKNAEAGSGSNPSPVAGRPSGSRFPSKPPEEEATVRAMKTPEILMVDDNPADIDLTSEVLAQSEGHSHVNAVYDGAEAISFLRREGKYTKAPMPDLVVLDLNLPRKHGCE